MQQQQQSLTVGGTTNNVTSSMNGNPSRMAQSTVAPVAQPFYPKLILAQIVAMQCFHYLLLAVCIQVNSVLFHTTISLDRIFTDHFIRLWSSPWHEHFDFPPPDDSSQNDQQHHWPTSYATGRLYNHQGGVADIFSCLLAALAGAVMLAVIVEKSKKCLDFGLTMLVLHVVFCTIYGGRPPTRLDWYVVQGLATTVTIVLGEYLCSLVELSDIPLLPLLSR
jgi:protein SYS1